MPTTLLFSFALAQACADLQSIDEVVMGGRSASRAVAFSLEVSSIEAHR